MIIYKRKKNFGPPSVHFPFVTGLINKYIYIHEILVHSLQTNHPEAGLYESESLERRKKYLLNRPLTRERILPGGCLPAIFST